MINLKKLLLALVLATFSVNANAADQVGIIASVGNEAITTKDLVDRTRLVIISSGMKADEETARKISTQVLQALINERLQIQEAARLGLDINNDEITSAIESIESQNKMQPGQLPEILGKAKISVGTLQQQVKGQIAWAKIRGRAIQPRIVISDDEVSDYLKSEAFNPQQIEYQLNEIILPVETTKDEAKIQETANKLAADLREDKSKFKSIAKQFSQAGSATGGGEVGWMAENQIPKELLSEIKKNEIGQIIGPIRSVEGYFILLVTESRAIDTHADLHTIALRQFEVPVINSKTEAETKILSLNDAAKACVGSLEYAKSKGVMLKDYGSIQIKELHTPVKRLVANLPTGEFSSVVDTGKTLIRFIICEKSEYLSGGVDDKMRARAREELTRKKLELESRKYMRDLRRNTNIEIKA